MKTTSKAGGWLGGGVIVLSLLQSVPSFAACERERQRRDDSKFHCDAATAASGAAMIAGAILLPPFGGLFGAGPGLVAQNQCKILKDRERSLRTCMTLAAQKREAKAQAERERIQKAQKLNTMFDARRDSARDAAEKELSDFILSFVTEGYDIQEPSIAAEIQAKKAQVEEQLRLALRDIEADRKAALERI